MLNNTQLQEIEAIAVKLARTAGLILLDYFKGPLRVDYKSANNRNSHSQWQFSPCCVDAICRQQ